jgi:hypothetical protein
MLSLSTKYSSTQWPHFCMNRQRIISTVCIRNRNYRMFYSTRDAFVFWRAVVFLSLIIFIDAITGIQSASQCQHSAFGPTRPARLGATVRLFFVFKFEHNSKSHPRSSTILLGLLTRSLACLLSILKCRMSLALRLYCSRFAHEFYSR